MSRARKLSLDRYITLATRGLPRRERLDTAAELRVHVLERVRELEGQGFPRSEAEHVAVAEMGLPEVTNRAFLGHFFTYRTGWAVLGLVAVGAGVWWGKDNLFPKESGIKPIELGLPELRLLQTDSNYRNSGATTFYAVRTVLPKDTVALEVAIFEDGISGRPTVLGVPSPGSKLVDGGFLPNNYRHEFTTVLGYAFSGPHCQTAPEMVFRMQMGYPGTVHSDGLVYSGCHTPQDRLAVGSIGETIHSQRIEINRWSVLKAVYFGPSISGCYSSQKSENRADCGPRDHLSRVLQNAPQKHPDRLSIVAIRPVDQQHKTDYSCFKPAKIKPTLERGELAIEPPQSCKS